MNTNRYAQFFRVPVAYDGEGDDTPNLEHPAVKAAIDKAVNAATEGLKGKNDELLGDLRSIKDKLSAFEGLDADDVRAKLKAMEDDADLKMVRDGKIDELVAKRTDKVKAEMEDALAKVNEQLASITAERDAAQNKLRSTTINDAIRKVATDAGISASAVEDVLLRASGVFSVNDAGEVEARDTSGSLVRVKVGDDGSERLLTPEVFIEQLRTSAPHFWPQGKGSGAGGSGGAGGGGSGGEDAAKIAEAARTGDMETYRKLRMGKK